MLNYIHLRLARRWGRPAVRRQVRLAKLLVGNMPPLPLAGLLYHGSGLGPGVLLLLRRARGHQSAQDMRIPSKAVPWLLGTILFGGVLAPALLMGGLTRTDGATASLLLNVEGVLTAVLAWSVFRENSDRQIVLGMVAIVAGGVLCPGIRAAPPSLQAPCSSLARACAGPSTTT